jgi:Flp pilus assembly protein TadG
MSTSIDRSGSSSGSGATLSTRANRGHRRNRRRRTRTGAAVVEFAVVGPLLVMLTMGMMEVGRVVMVKQMMVNASREGARLAILPTSTASQVISHVQSQMADSAINGTNVVLTPTSLENAPAGTAVTVTISVNANQVSWIPNPLFTFNKPITASTTMRRESL